MSPGETHPPGLTPFWSADSTLCVDLADQNEVAAVAGLDEEDGW